MKNKKNYTYAQTYKLIKRPLLGSIKLPFNLTKGFLSLSQTLVAFLFVCVSLQFFFYCGLCF